MDAATGLLSPLSYKPCYAEFYVSDVYVLVAAARRVFKMVSFTEAVSRRNTFVGGTCAPPSALVVCPHCSRCCLSHLLSNISHFAVWH